MDKTDSKIEAKQLEEITKNFYVQSEEPLKKEIGKGENWTFCVDTMRCCNLCASCLNNWCLCYRNVKNLSS